MISLLLGKLALTLKNALPAPTISPSGDLAPLNIRPSVSLLLLRIGKPKDLIMHQLKKLLTIVLVLPFLVASPVPDHEWDGKDGHEPRYNCISDSDAIKLASIWENFYVNFDLTLATKYLAPDLRVISDSINFLVAYPLKNVTVWIIPAFEYSILNATLLQATWLFGPAIDN